MGRFVPELKKHEYVPHNVPGLGADAASNQRHTHDARRTESAGALERQGAFEGQKGEQHVLRTLAVPVYDVAQNAEPEDHERSDRPTGGHLTHA